jgi:hypothetical protein
MSDGIVPRPTRIEHPGRRARSGNSEDGAAGSGVATTRKRKRYRPGSDPKRNQEDFLRKIY